MPFIFIDNGAAAIMQHHIKKQTGVSETQKSNTTEEINSQTVKPAVYKSSQHSSKAYQNTAKPKKVFTAQDIMTSPVITLELAHTTVQSAWQVIQQHNIKHLVITDKGVLYSLINESDLLKMMAFDPNNTSQDWLTKTVHGATRETDIHQLAHGMFDAHISSLPIINEHKEVLGIVTRSDILKLTSQYGPMEFWA